MAPNPQAPKPAPRWVVGFDCWLKSPRDVCRAWAAGQKRFEAVLLPETERLRSNFCRGGVFARQLPSFGLSVGQIGSDFHQKQRLSGSRQGQKPRLEPFLTLKAPLRAKVPLRAIFDQVAAARQGRRPCREGGCQTKAVATSRIEWRSIKGAGG